MEDSLPGVKGRMHMVCNSIPPSGSNLKKF
jgi:hypothetical protein